MAFIFTGEDNINANKYIHSVIYAKISTVHLLCISALRGEQEGQCKMERDIAFAFQKCSTHYSFSPIVSSPHFGGEEAHGRVVFTASLCWGQGI